MSCDVYRFLATGAETGGKYATLEVTVSPGGGPPPHIDRREVEAFYVLEGEVAFFINGERLLTPAGTFANMPIGSLLTFRTESDRPAKMLVTIAPAGLEAMFLQCGSPLRRAP